MARKKEYSITEGCAKKRNQQGFSATDNKTKIDSLNAKPKNLKRKDSGSKAGPSVEVYDVADLRAQLGSIGLTLRDIPGDGNCLFRALGDQFEGHSRNHMKHRMDTVRYMIAHRQHFEPFIDVPFERYIDNLSRPGTYAGQDSLVAFARFHQVNIVIHQLNSPLWQIEGAEGENARELHLSYHNGEHYSSVRNFGDVENTPAQVRIVSFSAAEERPCCDSLGKKCSTNGKGAADGSEINPRPVPKTAPLALPEPVLADNAYMPNEEEFAVLVSEVMLRSSCRDRALATEAFIDNECDMEQAVDYLLSLSLAWEGSRETAKEVVVSSDARPEPERLIKSETLINEYSAVELPENHPAKVRRKSACVSEKAREQLGDVILSSDLRFLTL